MFQGEGSEHKTRHRYAKINLSVVAQSGFSCNKAYSYIRILANVQELSLTILIQLIKTSIPQSQGIATELRISLPRCYLQIILSDPSSNPLDFAVAGEEPSAKTEAPEGGVEVGEGLHWEGVHGVAVQCQQCQGVDPGKCVVRQQSQEVEPKIKDLEGLTV